MPMSTVKHVKRKKHLPAHPRPWYEHASGRIAAVRISLASPEQIRTWSSGEVTCADTLHYRTGQPVKDGLFCERIFGPVKDWRCACGTPARKRKPGLVCEQCGIELAPRSVRRERMGHIELVAPVVHSWYVHGTPSIISLLLDLPARTLNQLLSAHTFVVLDKTTNASCTHHAPLSAPCAPAQGETRRPIPVAWKSGDLIDGGEQGLVQAISDAGDPWFLVTGAEALQYLLAALDLISLSRQLRCQIVAAQPGSERRRLERRLSVVEAFRTSGLSPAWMVLTVLPVLPPELRPLVPLERGSFATTDLNELYRRVLQRNARLRHVQAQAGPSCLLTYEKCLLQEAVDALLDNAHRKNPTKGANQQPLKSLTALLSGKEGRFRRSLLGKRVDFSGRSVICAGLDLTLQQCGLPKKIALELFKPHIMAKLLERGIDHTLRRAKWRVERHPLEVWDLLEEVMEGKVVLLNRAPTLHRLSIQAFEPVLVEGDAIRLHPLVCSAFNADFDGDQMAVHLPLSAAAQAEARALLLSTHNLRSPATGEPSISIAQEMVLGLFYLTQDRPSGKQAGRMFADEDEALLALDGGVIDLHTPIIVRMNQGGERQQLRRIATTAGRLLFNAVLPAALRYKNEAMTKEGLKQLIAECLRVYGMEETAQVADRLKTLGFRYATKSGLSFALSDIAVPPEKQTILTQAEKEVQEIVAQQQAGMVTVEECARQRIALWTQATTAIGGHLEVALDPWGSLSTIIKSGATKARFQQIRQLSGMRGLMASPSGQILPIPIKGNYLEGLRVWEIFLAASGARKGFMDRSLNTARSGYLTRKLVEAAMEVWITLPDCGTQESLLITEEECRALGLASMHSRVVGRILAEKVAVAGRAFLSAGVMLTSKQVDRLLAAGVRAIRVRSPLMCQAVRGLCQHCYGLDLATGELVRLGTAVGIIAAQSVGEPGTQLTMRTFHSGGIANAQGDITQGLPRVEELFEAKRPRNAALLSEMAGLVEIAEDSGQPLRLLRVVPAPDNGKNSGQGSSYSVPAGQAVIVSSGQLVTMGTPLTTGSRNPHEVLRFQGREAAARYLVNEVQRVYRGTGVFIADKHVECIVRQMLRVVKVTDAGDTRVLPGAVLDRGAFASWNAQVVAQGGCPATASPVLLGLTEVTLQTESWLAAASFQSTSKVLAWAALRGKIDFIQGFKNNVVLGQRIPTHVSTPVSVVPA